MHPILILRPCNMQVYVHVDVIDEEGGDVSEDAGAVSHIVISLKLPPTRCSRSLFSMSPSPNQPQ